MASSIFKRSIRWAHKIVEILSSNGGKGDFVLVEKANHGFVDFNSMPYNVETLGNGTYMSRARDNYSVLLGNETVKWMVKKIKN